MDTFTCDDCIVITIPLVKGDRGQSETLTPEKFHCVFKDSYKAFRKGQPKALGTTQIITGLLIITLGLVQIDEVPGILIYTMPSVMFLASGIISFAAGHSPNMCVTKTSFTLNIISLFWALTALGLCITFVSLHHPPWYSGTTRGINVIIAIQLSLEMLVATVLIYFESKAVCRTQFNTLPLINLKYV
ncbi:membrane-spanning 4-domains subfamily A member 15 [Brienomyrus brachyistius]|uniref:membrane-spanning 4-domains subfamily A member 15 n=1 Tax=Brienomyrus brachyistius TaxID=42636 RepID=UPI0020B3DD30|nr:membrane-spanning 4-domains subfamily A member 15 [Brienomyrus brachyistius]